MSVAAPPPHPVLIVDFGSQYTQLIARRIRQLRVYCEIVPHTLDLAGCLARRPAALVLSGGPASVTAPGAPDIDPAILRLDLPILGICYGQQLLAARLGGRVVAAQQREYGRASARIVQAPTGAAAPLTRHFTAAEPFDVWMSHGDHIEALPEGFVAVAATASTPFAAIAHVSRPIVGLQFHPEVTHTPRGIELLEAFVLGVAGCRPTWTMESFLGSQVAALRAQVGADEQVICGLSGGVDSAVTAALLARAVGPRLHCIFVDTGLSRRGEAQQVREIFAEAHGIPLHVVEAQAHFARALADVTDPERKRKIIGGAFVEVFEAEARRIPNACWLAQGTLYPDVVESVSVRGGGVTIKSHHNVGGLPDRMQLRLLEPLRELFKDEVRLLGAELGLPAHLCGRQPFPGPGLAVRIVGAVTEARCTMLRHADALVEEEFRAAQLYDRVWQSFAVLLPVRSVGVMGDGRTYEETIALRCVDSTDGMTADWTRLPYELLARLSSRIINEVHGINRVVYDISSKPPATIEWE